MPDATHEREEASQLLPLHHLGPHDSDGEDSDLDILAQEDYGAAFDAFDSKSPSISVIARILPRLPIPGFLRYQEPTPIRSKFVGSAARGRWRLRFFPATLLFLPFWIAFVFLFLPSYTRPPPHYTELAQRVAASTTLGRANPRNEKIFIAASVYDADGSLASSPWGDGIVELVDLLGPDNVFVSIYENDASEGAIKALQDFDKRLICGHTILNENLTTDDLQHVTMPDGRNLLKRIAFLAKVRNRALAPLEDATSPASKIKFDKLLYINDVVFQPVDVANLLLSTNLGPDGKTDYRAACAADFINPFKYYDTFATRDLEGFNMGVPFYPWFSAGGAGASRNDVLAQKDAVRVRSCWGGMVAFDAAYFQSNAGTVPSSSTDGLPVRFRAEEDPFWDASECCLIHADIQSVGTQDLTEDTGIYMNPFVRVAYDANTLAWLGLTRRLERMYSPFQAIANWVGKRPSYNPRRLEQPGQQVKDRVWVSDELAGTGAYRDVTRLAKPGGYCGGRKLLALPGDGHGGHWWNQPLPPDER